MRNLQRMLEDILINVPHLDSMREVEELARELPVGAYQLIYFLDGYDDDLIQTPIYNEAAVLRHRQNVARLVFRDNYIVIPLNQNSN